MDLGREREEQTRGTLTRLAEAVEARLDADGEPREDETPEALANALLLLRGFLGGVSIAEGLPPTELAQWWRRGERLRLLVDAERFHVARLTAEDSEAPDEPAERNWSQSSARAYVHLRWLLRRIEREPGGEAGATPQERADEVAVARAVATGYFHAGLIDGATLEAWEALFASATAAQLSLATGQTRPHHVPPPVTGEDLHEVVALDRQVGRWRCQSLELFRDGLSLYFWLERDARDGHMVPTARRPPVAVADDAGTTYAPSGRSGGSSEDVHHWHARFGPAVPPHATRLKVTVGHHRFEIPLR